MVVFVCLLLFYLIGLRATWKWLFFGSLTPSSHTTRILSRMHLAPYLSGDLGEIFLWSSSKAEEPTWHVFTPLGKKESIQTTFAGWFLGWLQNTSFTWALAPCAKKILPSQSFFLDRISHSFCFLLLLRKEHNNSLTWALRKWMKW